MLTVASILLCFACRGGAWVRRRAVWAQGAAPRAADNQGLHQHCGRPEADLLPKGEGRLCARRLLLHWSCLQCMPGEQRHPPGGALLTCSASHAVPPQIRPLEETYKFGHFFRCGCHTLSLFGACAAAHLWIPSHGPKPAGLLSCLSPTSLLTASPASPPLFAAARC